MRVRDSHEPGEGKDQLPVACTHGRTLHGGGWLGCLEPTDASVQDGIEKQLLQPRACQRRGLGCSRAPRICLYMLGGVRTSAASEGKTTDVNKIR